MATMGAIIMITLQKALNVYNRKNVNLQMRTYRDKKNTYLGMCDFVDGELVGDDRFHLEDEVLMWEAPEENKMIVWLKNYNGKY